MKFLSLVCLGVLFGTVPTYGAGPDGPTTQVGVAQVDITPAYPIRLSGYAARKSEASDAESRLKARAIAIGSDAEGPVVLVTVDNCGVPGKLADEVAGRLEARASLPRERFAVCSTHTHCAPALDTGVPFLFGGPLPAGEQEHVARYTRELADAMEKVAAAALAAREPARLAWARGSVGFATNRRMLKDGRWTGFGANPDGPVDRGLPVLRASGPDGKVRAVLVGYACHCTTLGGDFNRVCAEWAGYACDEIERANSGALALVVIGCGADADPQPRFTVANARRHGEAIAREAVRLLGTAMTPLPGKVATSFRRIELPLAETPTRDQFAARATRPGSEGFFARTMLRKLDRGEPLPKTVRYPVQTWCFGDGLAMVLLGGEVVVDYALRLRRECDPARLWTVAYSNDMPCYIASKRILREGGYEADDSMIYYGQPTRLAPETEDRIVETVHDLLPDAFDKAKP